MEQKNKKRQAGFTLVEVMVTMVIIGLLTTAVVLNVIPMLGKAQSEKAQIDINRLKQAIEYYHLETNTYPNQLSDLLAAQGSENSRAGGYIEALPQDPWNNAYLYSYPGDNGVFDIWSLGADGVEGGEDNNADITSWQN